MDMQGMHLDLFFLLLTLMEGKIWCPSSIVKGPLSSSLCSSLLVLSLMMDRPGADNLAEDDP